MLAQGNERRAHNPESYTSNSDANPTCLMGIALIELKQAAMITALIIPTYEPLKYKSVLMLWCNCKLPQATHQL
ncbi:hypothetical protein N7489_005274 [Penicillium chrysogenum]|uniref:uncharacterized protein n=1 Tax=Penicillium chrysogenum TaxID=5076 RepID=UPI002393E719|nr:uncharacterized protein N7489_005274 [Penicillium chrysogenum]KAJ5245178.1 hypothetical protein N7489_005274 [Penicillium chrysogenum]KAJ5285217.1 hypothetical protein N7524_000523 [Penicillium chrysogenum]KAJ6156447.1 hypothetical protein N7497_005332 [Penicillium chrysogenum]